MRVAWNEIDPLADAFTYALTAILVGNVNAEIIEQAAVNGIALAEEELNGEVTTIPAEVIARPSKAETENVAPTPPSVINYFGPAVLALVIQHLGVSLTALSLVRERRGGQIDRYRVAPVGAAEVLLGKYAAYGLLALLTGTAVMLLLVGVLGVPMIGGWLVPAAVAGVLALASLGAGIVISLLADSERQAVQLSMLLLLASVFLSGLVLPVSDFAWWIEPIAYLLPVTHGIAALQETMLRGELQSVWTVATLTLMAVVFYVAAVVLLRRALRSAA
jgi:ABC-2 type transport system permease protein